MKKLILFSLLALLVACNPSETESGIIIERCIEYYSRVR